MTKPYKEYQLLYQELVKDHEDDFSKVLHRVTPNVLADKIFGAMDFFRYKRIPIVYPGKTYAVAIVYAYHIEKDYGIPLRETLDDPDLFMGHDAYFVRYSKDPQTYEAILKELEKIPQWWTSGWAEKTSQYYRLECTEEGIQQVINGES